MKDYTKDSLKNHGKMTARIFLCHMLAVALGWAAFPLMVILLARYMTVDVPLGVFSVFATVVYALMLLGISNEQGVIDLKPYRWARYKAKGFVTGALCGAAVVLLELLMIAIADRTLVVSHPQFMIANLNRYLRLILVVPFFWFYKLLSPEGIVPLVTGLSALFVIPFTSLFCGIGYLLGANGVVVDFRKGKKEKKSRRKKI